MMHKHKQWVKLPIMARMLSRCVKQFRKDVKKYNIPHIELGRDKLFDPERVIQYLTVEEQSPVHTTLVLSPTDDSPPKNSQKIKFEIIKTERYKSLLGLE